MHHLESVSQIAPVLGHRDGVKKVMVGNKDVTRFPESGTDTPMRQNPQNKRTEELNSDTKTFTL
jgi:hypothetical protein